MQGRITEMQYMALQKAFDFFNEELFENTLPQVLITLHRHSKAFGYFAPKRFLSRDKDKVIHELALNPESFTEDRCAKRILSTMVHEMAHLWQHENGKPSRGNYHNREWANRMEEIGLMPSATGEEGGAKVGPCMTHYIIEGGQFDDFFMLTEDPVAILAELMVPAPKNKAKNKVKYTCPSCGQKAWAKPEARLMCGECEEHMED